MSQKEVIMATSAKDPEIIQPIYGDVVSVYEPLFQFFLHDKL